jgi:periplasmic divalent cation tolerance protein
MADEILLALSTFPDLQTARRIVSALVEARLVACGNIVPQVESIYRWQGKVETTNEVLVLFKVPAQAYAAFESKVKEFHPYEVPEIIAVDIARGLPQYLRWAAEAGEN